MNNKVLYTGEMDEECIPICDALNELPTVETTDSCCGHGKNPFMIFLNVTDMYSLSILSRTFDKRYIGTSMPWHVELITSDGGTPKYHIYLHSAEIYANHDDMVRDVAIIISNLSYWSQDTFKQHFLENLASLEAKNKEVIDNLISDTPKLMMNFSQALGYLKKYELIRRQKWDEGVYVVKQVPSHITEDIIPRMQSLPSQAKEALMQNAKHIDYRCQCLLVNTKTGIADSWIPSMEDIFAEDWCV